MKIFSIFFFFLLLFLFSIKVEAKDYDGNNFICADEIGPILEFPVPKLVGNNTKKKIIIKLFEKQNRNQQIRQQATIQKKTSPIDNTYFYYEVNYISSDKKTKNLKFEFFPPTTAMFQIEGTQFVDLVCWQNKNLMMKKIIKLSVMLS